MLAFDNVKCSISISNHVILGMVYMKAVVVLGL